MGSFLQILKRKVNKLGIIWYLSKRHINFKELIQVTSEILEAGQYYMSIIYIVPMIMK